MKVIHSDQPMETGPVSLFLAGPTPRSIDVKSWRIEALEILALQDFFGLVYVPERQNPERQNRVGCDYLEQVEWEYQGLKNASLIVFWVPRNMQTLPGLTTNVEMGYWLAKKPLQVFYGRPDNAEHTRYLDWLYTKFSLEKPINNLSDLLLAANERLLW